MRTETLTVEAQYAGQRMDKVLAVAVEGLSRTAAQELCETGQVSCTGKPAGKSLQVALGDVIT